MNRNQLYTFWPNKTSLASGAVVQWRRRCAAEPKDAGLIPAAVATFQMEAKRKRLCVEILAHIEDAQVIKINPEPSTAEHLVAQVQFLCLKCNYRVLKCFTEYCVVQT